MVDRGSSWPWSVLRRSGHYSSREMLSFFTFPVSMDRFIPRWAAAPSAPPSARLVSQRVPKIWCRSTSVRLTTAQAGAACYRAWLGAHPGHPPAVSRAPQLAVGFAAAHHAFMNHKTILRSSTRCFVTGVGKPASRYQSWPRCVRMPGVSVTRVRSLLARGVLTTAAR